MRSYRHNSPQAAARLVALAVLADGHFSASELGLLERLNAAVALGLSPEQLHEVMRHLSEDLITSTYAQWGSVCQIDSDVLKAVMAEVSDPALRQTTLELCVAVVRADFYIAGSEDNLIGAVAAHWRVNKPGIQLS